MMTLFTITILIILFCLALKAIYWALRILFTMSAIMAVVILLIIVAFITVQH